jgi:hypothetical protein
MFKGLVIGLIIFLVFINVYISSSVRFFDHEDILVKVENVLNRTLHYCKVIDDFLFKPLLEPLKVRFIPGYVSAVEDFEEDKESQIQIADESEKPVVSHEYAKIYLKTGFVADGKVIDSEGGTVTIEMDGYPVTFTQSEISSINYYTK